MSKRNRIIYWVATLWLSLGMVATGLVQLTHQQAEGALAPPGVYGFQQLGYPVYLMTILGAWKLLGVVALLVPRLPLLKEWAYAGFTFLITGAIFSHIAVKHPAVELLPSFLLLALTAISWYLRPAGRKLSATVPS